MKAVSLDLWGTLIKSNPKFKEAQADLVMNYDIRYTFETWLNAKNQIKKFNDTVVSTTSSHMDRELLYKLLLPSLTSGKIKQFIKESDDLFIKHPPLIKEDFNIVELLRFNGFNCYLSSNTMFVYGKTLFETVVEGLGFKREDCKFSDEVGYSKPHFTMFEFPIKPTYHLGDNLMTDGSCVKFDIEFIEVNDIKTLRSFVEEKNINQKILV